MEYKIHQYRFDNFTRYEDIIRQALNELGYTETDSPIHGLAGLNIYNHCHISEVFTDNNIIFKPTAPTSQHFALDKIGYANSSELAFKRPDINPDIEQMDWEKILNLKHSKCNKWDNSIILKWRKPKKEIPKDHILIIAQMPNDETVKGFGFGNHLSRVNDIAFKLHEIRLNKPFIIKMHPSFKPETKEHTQILRKWKQNDFDVRMGYESIHDYLKLASVAIVDNSTAGIDCLMHEVPIISYGWPEYHWATEKLQSLTQLKDLVSDLSWHKPIYSNQFIEWYINHYLCSDINSTVKRLKQLLWNHYS